MNEKRAIIAMSGGVDSSVAAYLMKSRGFRCKGTTMRLYRNEDIGISRYKTCCSQEDINDAAEVAFKLDIPFEVLDFTSAFKKEIIEKFVRTYETGGTPNPCIDCNRIMKFSRLMQYAQENDFSYLVTGHYARIENGKNGRTVLKKALDKNKDQSYVLYGLTQEQLSHTIFPLGEITKGQVRKIAEEQGFLNFRKPDSQDICFIPDGDYVKFMETYRGKEYMPGEFIDTSGQVIGYHKGTVRFTIGQRKGLGLSAGKKMYVCSKCMEDGTVTVGEEKDLLAGGLYADDINWVSVPRQNESFRCMVKTRYRQTEQPAKIYPLENGIMVSFDVPQRAITPGQAVVLYDGDIVLGGGTITKAIK